MLNFSDLGLGDAATQQQEPKPAGDALDNTKNALVRGSVEAQALYAVWSGEPVVTVDSPPGAGKSRLVANIVLRLLRDSDMEIVVGLVANAACRDLARRIVAESGWTEGQPELVRMNLRNRAPIPGVRNTGESVQEGDRFVTIRTLASLEASAQACDLLIFDEAYMTTFAQAAAAAEKADQILMVGDPGQIGPVVTIDTKAYRRDGIQPHMRAPEAFCDPSSQITPLRLHLDTTYRLGQATVDVIAPLYDFPFASGRPDRVLHVPAGASGATTPVGEITHLPVAPATGKSDLAVMRTVADTAVRMVGSVVKSPGVDDVTVTEGDVAVVVAHRDQEATVGAILSAFGHDGITVGTADSLQGGQWHAVVALDPCIGHATAGGHQMSLGRLCVMASRHLTSMVWVHDDRWEATLGAKSKDRDRAVSREAAKGVAVRTRLTGMPAFPVN